MKNRVCFRCKRLLEYQDYCKTNSSLPKTDLDFLWENDYVQLFCCNCLRIHGTEYGMNPQKKVIITSMLGSGKTNLVRFLEQSKNQEAFSLSSPEITRTVKVKFLLLDGVYIVWEFANMRKYFGRFERIRKYLRKSNELVFLIDIQKQSLFDASLKYLEKLLSYEEISDSKDFLLTILFSKYDTISKKLLTERESILLNRLDGIVKGFKCSIGNISLKSSTFSWVLHERKERGILRNVLNFGFIEVA